MRSFAAVITRLLLFALLDGLCIAGLTVARVQPPRDAMYIHLIGWLMVGTALIGAFGLGIEVLDQLNRHRAARREAEQSDSHGSLVLFAIVHDVPDRPSRHHAIQGNRSLQGNPRGYLPLPNDPIRYLD